MTVDHHLGSSVMQGRIRTKRAKRHASFSLNELARLFRKNKLSHGNRPSSLTLRTFKSEDEEDYEDEFSVLSMRIRFVGPLDAGIFRSAHAQNETLVLEVVLVARSKGPELKKS